MYPVEQGKKTKHNQILGKIISLSAHLGLVWQVGGNAEINKNVC